LRHCSALVFCYCERFFAVIPSVFSVIPSASEESIAWMLHSAQHDKGKCGRFTSLRSVQHDNCDVISSAIEESSAMWMLRFTQHD
jgi:hypothetical protein